MVNPPTDEEEVEVVETPVQVEAVNNTAQGEGTTLESHTSELKDTNDSTVITIDNEVHPESYTNDTNRNIEKEPEEAVPAKTSCTHEYECGAVDSPDNDQSTAAMTLRSPFQSAAL